MIKVKNISKEFDKSPVLTGISTTFEKGKTNLIIGQSGSGKTVFLKCLLGLFETNSGQIFFENNPINLMSTKERSVLRQEIGMVFQGSALFDSMTVEENIMFPMQMFTKKDDNEVRERANQVIKRVNLINKNKLFPSEISGGMKKRVSIARAIVLSPKYLICDEPNSGLDPYTSILIDNLLQEITYENNMTTIINTHDMNSLMQIGDKILYINNGLVVWEGNKDQILDSTNHELNKFVFSSRLFKKIKLNIY